jgi:hypothetical protein
VFHPWLHLTHPPWIPVLLAADCCYLFAMTDPRYAKLAKLLIEYSARLKRGEHVLLDVIDVPDEFSVELMRAARSFGIPTKSTRLSCAISNWRE